LTALFCAGSAQPRQVAKFSYKGQPEDFHNTTIKVDGDMVAMSEKIFVKNFTAISDSVSDTPSVFFIIDNSGSMTGDNGADPLGNRFTMTSSFIDTLKKNFPDVEVGVSVFRDWLMFDTTDKPYFQTCATQTNGAYVPLLTLGKTYLEFGNKTGYEILKEILTIKTNGTLLYQPTNTVLRSSGTNINAGFDAAKCAFAQSLNFNRKNKQYIVFLSDGLPTSPPAPADKNSFQLGVNTATTFSIFFLNGSTVTVPSSFSTMTTNIKNNGYSTSNPKSAYWGYQNSTPEALMSFLMDSIFTFISTNSVETPKSVTIGGTTSSNWVNGTFTFGSLFPLTGPITTFNFTITYGLYEYSKYIKDTTHAVNNFRVMIDPPTTLTPDKYEVKHWNRDLLFLHNNAVITAATENMDTLVLRFLWSPGDAAYAYTKALVECSTVRNVTHDVETYSLTKESDSTFSVKISRIPSNAPVSGNGILEQAANDTIVAIFRNTESPKLPLDTLRIAIPSKVAPRATISSAVTRDIDGDGLLDRVDVAFDTIASLSVSDLALFTVSSGSQVFQVDSIIKRSDRTYTLRLREQATSTPQTGLLPQIKFAGVSFISSGSVVASDGAGPVAWRAIHSASLPMPGATTYFDTLRVTLSEPVLCNTVMNGTVSASFKYILGGNGTNNQLLSNAVFVGTCNQQYSNSFIFVVPSSALTIIPGKDSLQFIGAAKDSTGNGVLANSRRASIEAGPASTRILLTAGPNPLIIGKNNIMSTFPPSMVTFYREVIGPATSGMIISFNTVTSLQPQEDGTFGTLVIYDAVGNIVRSKIPIKKAGTSKDFGSLWDGKNRSGRFVGSGTYLAVASVRTAGEDKNQTIKIKIGVKRQ
jgi:hypothetical protein